MNSKQQAVVWIGLVLIVLNMAFRFKTSIANTVFKGSGSSNATNVSSGSSSTATGTHTTPVTVQA
jgi:hypothetical protein